jgi:hypothetical protein
VFMCVVDVCVCVCVCVCVYGIRTSDEFPIASAPTLFVPAFHFLLISPNRPPAIMGRLAHAELSKEAEARRTPRYRMWSARPAHGHSARQHRAACQVFAHTVQPQTRIPKTSRSTRA